MLGSCEQGEVANPLLKYDLPHQNGNANAASLRPAYRQADQKHQVKTVPDSRRAKGASELWPGTQVTRWLFAKSNATLDASKAKEQH